MPGPGIPMGKDLKGMGLKEMGVHSSELLWTLGNKTHSCPCEGSAGRFHLWGFICHISALLDRCKYNT